MASSENRVSSRPASAEVVAQVAAGLLGGHGRHRVAQPDALVERGEDAEFHPPPQGGLADEQAGERAGGVHVVVGEHPDRFELVVVEQVRLVDHHDGGAAAFGVFDGQRVGGLRDQGGVVGQGLAAERGDDLVVDAADPDRGVGQVDDRCAGWGPGRRARRGRRRSSRRRPRR